MDLDRSSQLFSFAFNRTVKFVMHGNTSTRVRCRSADKRMGGVDMRVSKP